MTRLIYSGVSSAEAKSNCSHSSRCDQLRSHSDPCRSWIHGWFHASVCSLSEKSFHLRRPLEVLELQELRLCRSHRQDPGRTSVNEDDLAQTSVMREGFKPTHRSSVHHGVLPSVALNIQKENVQTKQNVHKRFRSAPLFCLFSAGWLNKLPFKLI